MPEHTNLTITHYSILRAQNSFINSKILMIARKNLIGINSVIIKADKVFDDVEQAVFLENAFKESCKICKGLGFHVAVFCLPFHKAVFTTCDGSRLACKLVAHYADTVVNKHGWYFMNIIANLKIRLRCICLLTRR